VRIGAAGEDFKALAHLGHVIGCEILETSTMYRTAPDSCCSSCRLLGYPPPYITRQLGRPIAWHPRRQWLAVADVDRVLVYGVEPEGQGPPQPKVRQAWPRLRRHRCRVLSEARELFGRMPFAARGRQRLNVCPPGKPHQHCVWPMLCAGSHLGRMGAQGSQIRAP
jgi:hypothetical protein